MQHLVALALLVILLHRADMNLCVTVLPSVVNVMLIVLPSVVNVMLIVLPSVVNVMLIVLPSVVMRCVWISAHGAFHAPPREGFDMQSYRTSWCIFLQGFQYANWTYFRITIGSLYNVYDSLKNNLIALFLPMSSFFFWRVYFQYWYDYVKTTTIIIIIIIIIIITLTFIVVHPPKKKTLSRY